MSKIPFDIKWKPQIESGEYKVETDCKEPVTIIKWDLKNDNGNILCYYFDGKEDIPYVTEGKDLFIITPEEELSEFENRLCEILDSAINYQIHSTDEETIKEAKELAHELFDLARTELIFQGNIILSTEESKKRFAEAQEKGRKEAFHDAVENISDKHQAEMSVEYSIHCKVENGVRRAVMNWDEFQKVAQKFIDIGKVDALKDLPRWRHAYTTCSVGNRKQKNPEYPYYSPNDKAFIVLLENSNEAKCLMLDDLKKLPGFKEESHE